VLGAAPDAEELAVAEDDDPDRDAVAVVVELGADVHADPNSTTVPAREINIRTERRRRIPGMLLPRVVNRSGGVHPELSPNAAWLSGR